MRKLWGTGIATALVAVALSGAPGASAATELGSECQAKLATTSTLVQLANTGPVVTVESGVVTRWKVNAGAAAYPLVEKLKVFKQLVGTEYETVGESAEGVVRPNRLNVFDTRIPVQGGIRFGVSAATGSEVAYCKTEAGSDTMGIALGDPAIGSKVAFTPELKYRVAVVGVVEPDIDGDGYGDETQDLCPRSASVQTACGPVNFTVTPLVKSGSVVVLTATDVEAKVTSSGTVGKIRLHGITHTVKPGQIGRSVLKFPAKLKAELADLPASRSLKLQIKTHVQNAGGLTTAKTTTVKLRGHG